MLMHRRQGVIVQNGAGGDGVGAIAISIYTFTQGFSEVNL